MTQTMTAPITIPAEGLVHTAGDVELTVRPHPVAGYLIQGRRNGVIARDLCSQHNTEWAARIAWAKLLEQYPATPAPVDPAPAAPAIPAQRPAPAPIPGNATGHLRVSDPSHTVLALAATDPDGIVRQGGGLGHATRTQLRSLAKKGYLELIYEKRTDARKVPEAGRITAKGRARLAELTAADAHNARIAAAVAGTPYPTAA
ncbi:hypothetical protein GCM10010399_64030 [Dactylosporangium fulvum]|uniref:MarR family transcriptional regulator n=1 Tax=Dactylosporangium fulvum TaxID=53359 RepID=A0ABY5W979_9ACTN|nr:hypothetical protein [Dactylosporangium fulvum]UWP85774.1 hypothetical protein Dfulv_16640 [Dactylosporangium fulvum]